MHNTMSPKWKRLYHLIDFIVLIAFGALVFFFIQPLNIYISVDGGGVHFWSIKLLILLPLSVVLYLVYAFVITPILLKIGIWDGLTLERESAVEDEIYANLCTQAHEVQATFEQDKDLKAYNKCKKILVKEVYKPVYDYITRFIKFIIPLLPNMIKAVKGFFKKLFSKKQEINTVQAEQPSADLACEQISEGQPEETAEGQPEPITESEKPKKKATKTKSTKTETAAAAEVTE